MYVIGIDPGPVVGITGIWLAEDNRIARTDVAQCSVGCVQRVLKGLLLPTSVVAVERFVVGSRSARSNTARAGEAARSVQAVVVEWSQSNKVHCVERSAAEVKPWATDTRLDAAGLLAPTTGMRHARDAARHALFAAVKTYGLPDPLSKASHWGNGVGGVGLAKHQGTKANCSAPECGA